ncbi:MAG TPA: universal stress protein, partial [Pyrinomonadaceae bacterium]
MINIHRILCPIDMSAHSAGAVRYAVALARAYEAELILLHCTDAFDAYQTVKASVSEYVASSDLRWRLLVPRADDVDEEIINRAQAESVDLIVMRSRRRPHRAALLGSTAESVCRNAPCPVLVL